MVSNNRLPLKYLTVDSNPLRWMAAWLQPSGHFALENKVAQGHPSYPTLCGCKNPLYLVGAPPSGCAAWESSACIY